MTIDADSDDDFFVKRHKLLSHLTDEHEMRLDGMIELMYRYGTDGESRYAFLFGIHNALPSMVECKNWKENAPPI